MILQRISVALLALSTIVTPNVVAKDEYQHTRAVAQSPLGAPESVVQSDLLAAFNQTLSWPAKIPFDTTQYLSLTGPFPKSQKDWRGLQCVFPNARPGQYPTLLGINESPDSHVTAGQVAAWIFNWAQLARKVVPQYSPSINPYTYVSDYDIWYQTDVKGPSTIISGPDAKQIEANLIDTNALLYRKLAKNKVQLLYPMISLGYPKHNPPNYANLSWALWDTEFELASSSSKNRVYFSWHNFPEIYAKLISLYDSSTITLIGPERVSFYERPDHQYSLGMGFSFAKGGMVIASNEANFLPNTHDKKAIQTALNQRYPETFTGNNAHAIPSWITGQIASWYPKERQLGVGSNPISSLAPDADIAGFGSQMVFLYHGTTIDSLIFPLGGSRILGYDYPSWVELW